MWRTSLANSESCSRTTRRVYTRRSEVLETQCAGFYSGSFTDLRRENKSRAAELLFERESPSRTPEREYSPRLDSEECTIVFSRQDVQKTVGSLAHVPDSLTQLHQHRFPAEFLP